MKQNGARLGMIVAALTLAGCAAIQPRAGFSDVQQLVSARTEAQINWNPDGSADPEVEQHVKDLLAGGLTADVAAQIALLNSRKLQAIYQQLGIAQADLVQAGLLRNPVLNADVRFGVGSVGTGADVGVVQEFISILQIPLRKRVAAAAFAAAKLEVAQAVVEQAGQAKRSFYRLQGDLQMLELRRTVAEATELSSQFAQRQHEAGNNTALDLANEQALAEQAKLDLAESETEVQDDREDLNGRLGLWGDDTTWSVAARLPDLPEEELRPQGLESLAVTQRLDLAAARQEAEVLAQSFGLTRSYRLLPQGAAGAASQRETERGTWSLGPAVALPIPLFDQGQAAVASAAARLRQSEEKYAALAIDIRVQVRRARTRLLAARRRAEYYRAVVLPLRRRIVEQTQLQYNGMLVGVFQLLQSKKDEVDAGHGYIAALTDYWVARAELEQAVGGRLPPAGDAPASRAG